ncbi:MAG: peptide MFS transporter [Bacteroidales bacterium]|jgi:POT family proton-dependent oligopeptide transporter|nr:peptide MFS transporter [Bacteroidales bacterium]MCK9449508.1 peptide MFS transporter [Bacteroidales bacterium]MDD3700410.1 peptide MFS transporter [Bacteroidales bacterium]MDY0368704.1 peptide MFS transporter [Bacteroidales bacterium]
MFKGHPKGLISAALANMGERFGFYTMMAILTLFLMSKFNISGTEAGTLYSIFYGAIYALALVGGIIADKSRNYKGTIIAGLVVMAAGYAFLALPAMITSKYIALGALLVIAFGNGLFKGNLQAIVGQMYDNPDYAHKRDSGFQIFYMFINLGAMFAPFLATWVRNTFVAMQGYKYNAELPGFCHQFLDGKMAEDVVSGRFTELATLVSDGAIPDNLNAFAVSYLDAFNTGFHYAFLTAVFAMFVSLAIFLGTKKMLPNPTVHVKKTEVSKEEIMQDAKEIKQRILALFAVFGVVIFFWFSFHQNGLTLTMFAKDYTLLGGIFPSVESFQSINPILVVTLTPIIIFIFSRLAKRGKEPSTPKKIAIGMGIAATAFIIMTIGSLGLPKLSEVTAMGGLPDIQRVTPWLLFGVYFVLTVAELFISPLGLSFVSKVAPAHLQGAMQGGWLAATAVGNVSLFLGAMMYENISISVTWSVFVIVCLISMITMFAMVKWLERVAK